MLHPSYPYIVFNDLPKVDNLKRLFANAYREMPVTVMASSKTGRNSRSPSLRGAITGAGGLALALQPAGRALIYSQRPRPEVSFLKGDGGARQSAPQGVDTGRHAMAMATTTHRCRRRSTARNCARR